MKNFLELFVLVILVGTVFTAGIMWRHYAKTAVAKKEISKFEKIPDSVILGEVYYFNPQSVIDENRQQVISDARGKNLAEIKELFIEICTQTAEIYAKNILLDSIPDISQGNMVQRYQAVKRHLDKKYAE